MLCSSTVPENDARRGADTAYEIGDSVILRHRVYKAVARQHAGQQPDQHSGRRTDAAWRLMGPTNRYAMLDQYVSTQTVAAEDVMTFTVTFNRCSVALLNFKATSIPGRAGRRRPLVMYDRTVNTLRRRGPATGTTTSCPLSASWIRP